MLCSPNTKTSGIISVKIPQKLFQISFFWLLSIVIIGSIQHLHQKKNWYPKISRKEGLEKTIAYFKNLHEEMNDRLRPKTLKLLIIIKRTALKKGCFHKLQSAVIFFQIFLVFTTLAKELIFFVRHTFLT